ncbi:MAG: hypothetical protein AAGE80_07340 [Pseudomonadota bacterium]
MPAKTVIATLLMATAFVAVAPDPADAMRRGGSNAVPEQRLKLKAEFAQARRAGGYENPFSSIMKLFRGDDLGNAVQPVINDPEPDSIFDAFK